MPNIKSAIKRVKVSEKKNLRNRIAKTKVKTAVKKYDAAVTAGDKAAAEALMRAASGEVDKAASKGTIHRNAANRKKAQLAKKLNTI
ncbi:MAG: 30S ribosomal protein S20 [Bacillota bacterium]|nr:30S ribosomal protein S20 [Bacillota bacterium]